MKFLLFFILFTFSANFSAQNNKLLYLKGNALFVPLGMINLGLEKQISRKYTLQGDVFISPWESFANNHAQIYMGHLEGRYYFHEAFRKWYVGINFGMGLFDITKWNYQSNRFQRGYNLMVGAAAGYQFRWKEKWNIDIFLGGGSSQAFYHGYEESPPHFFRYDGAEKWNKSGEFLPYRGGVMIAYKLR